jgi:hypothetical protein
MSTSAGSGLRSFTRRLRKSSRYIFQLACFYPGRLNSPPSQEATISNVAGELNIFIHADLGINIEDLLQFSADEARSQAICVQYPRPACKERRKSWTRASSGDNVQINGNLMVGKANTAQLGLKPGDEIEIKLGRKQIKLIPLGSTDDEE